MERWRLLDIETLDLAGMNLAIDEAVFIEKTKKTVPPTIRFWRNKHAVVVGYFQSIEAEVNIDLCRERGIEIVRRFSGGGAVYHDLGNLNYSIAIDADHPLVKGLDIIKTFEVLSSGVVKGLKTIGVDLVFVPPSNLLVGNKKISGNAQSRKRGVIFHHGTLLVNADLDLLTRALNPPKEKVEKGGVTSKKRRVTNLEDEIGFHINMEKVKKALRRGFEEAFYVKMEPSELSSDEKENVERLYIEKYSKREWNFWR